MKIEIEKKNHKWIAIGVAGVILIVTAGGAYFSKAASNGEAVYKEVTVERGNITVGVTEGGSVSIGTLTQEYELGSSSSGGSSQSYAQGMGGMTTGTSSSSGESLEIAEVYVVAGQNVEVGAPLYKLSAESVAEYRESLQDAVSDASASLAEAKLNAEKQQLTANYNYSSSIAKGNVAESEYNATLIQLEEELEKAQEDYNYYVELEAYLLSLYNQNPIYADSYENAVELREQAYVTYSLAQSNYNTKSLEAKKKYEQTMLEYNNASSQYSIDVNGIDSDTDSASDTLADAKEALAEFEAFVGDGVIYAEYGGKLLSVGYGVGDTLSSDTAIATYADAESVSMTVSVSQEDISVINVGDEVLIELTAYDGEEFKGVVSGMDTSTSSGSSTVSYNVTVVFAGDASKVYTDMTGNVTFIQKQMTDVVFVSNKAILNEGTKSYVKVKDAKGNFEKKEVETGFSNGVYVEIKSGLNEGEIAIIESQVEKK